MAFNPFKYAKEFATSGVIRKEAGESISKSWESHPGNWSLGLGAGSALAFGTGHPYVGGALGIGAGYGAYSMIRPILKSQGVLALAGKDQGKVVVNNFIKDLGFGAVKVS